MQENKNDRLWLKIYHLKGFKAVSVKKLKRESRGGEKKMVNLIKKYYWQDKMNIETRIYSRGKNVFYDNS